MSPSGPSFHQFNLVVRDMEATLRFYRRLGLEIPETDPAWAPHHRNAVIDGGIDLDFDSVAFARQWDAGWHRSPGDGMGVLGFRLGSREEVDAVHSDLVAAGYRSQQQPYDAFWGARYAVIEDPDGNAVGLMSPVDPQRRTPTPPPAHDADADAM